MRIRRRRTSRSTGPRRRPPAPGERLSSYPFVSGDTFRLSAEHVVDGTDATGALPDPATIRARAVVFLEVPFLAVEAHRSAVIGWLERCISSGAPPRLVVHNGDHGPDERTLADLAARSSGVWCVNAPDGIAGVTPIPIGLENVHHGTNGVLAEFVAALHDPGLRTLPRTRPVLAAFRSATNPAVRAPLERAAARSRHGFAGVDMTPAEHRAELRRTALVLSPPGNGADCHRTWEAMLLGAVPVVLRGSVAPSLVDELPVLQLDRIEDALSLTDDEILTVHEELSTRPIDRALMPYWIRDLEGLSGRTPR